MSRHLMIVLFFLLLLTNTACGQIPGLEKQSAIVKAALEGDARARGVLAGVYRRGEWGSIDYNQSLQWAELAAAQGDPLGLYNLAVMYETGLAVGRDSVLAADLYHRATIPMRELATTGDCRARVNLGYLLESSDGPEGLRNALKWYRLAASDGDARAQYILGYKHYHGWGVEQDYQEAIRWLGMAADQGYATAQHFLGNMYYNGIGVTQNNTAAIGFYRQAEAFQNNSEQVSSDTSHYIFNGIPYPGDSVIGGLLPPVFRLDISEGSCGEACLWSLVNSTRFNVSQLDLNELGGSPDRGLHANEMHLPLEELDFSFIDRMGRSYLQYSISYLNPFRHFVSHSDKYRDFLYNVVIANLKQGNPVILGVKIYPDKHYLWDCDHFILLVGYNEESNELIYNNFNKRERIHAEQLLTDTAGYSLLNRYHFTNCIIVRASGRLVDE